MIFVDNIRDRGPEFIDRLYVRRLCREGEDASRQQRKDRGRDDRGRAEDFSQFENPGRTSTCAAVMASVNAGAKCILNGHIRDGKDASMSGESPERKRWK